MKSLSNPALSARSYGSTEKPQEVIDISSEENLVEDYESQNPSLPSFAFPPKSTYTSTNSSSATSNCGSARSLPNLRLGVQQNGQAATRAIKSTTEEGFNVLSCWRGQLDLSEAPSVELKISESHQDRSPSSYEIDLEITHGRRTAGDLTGVGNGDLQAE